MQLSSIPSIVGVQAAFPIGDGVLAGYADSQFPPVESDWRARFISFGDAALGAEHIVAKRNSSELGWSRVSFALSNGRLAATASDRVTGGLFVPLDATGAPTAPAVPIGEGASRYLLGTSTGFSTLASPYDENGSSHGPVALKMLDASGHVTGTRALVDASATWYSRIGFLDGSFLMLWQADGPCTGCRTFNVRHFDETGNPLAGPMVAHSFDANTWGTVAIAPSSKGFLLAWNQAAATPGTVDLMAAAFDADGNALAQPAAFSQTSDTLALHALGAAPGGDLIAVWADGAFADNGKIVVQSVSADGKAEGAATTVGTASLSSTEIVLVGASAGGAVVVYESVIGGYGIEAFAIPLRCAK